MIQEFIHDLSMIPTATNACVAEGVVLDVNVLILMCIDVYDDVI